MADDNVYTADVSTETIVLSLSLWMSIVCISHQVSTLIYSLTVPTALQ